MNEAGSLPSPVELRPAELEALKVRNDERARADHRRRPDVAAAMPQYLTIANTYKCDLECPMCFKQLDDFANMSLPDMEWGVFERVAQECFPYLRRINLSVSGEPLVSRNIFRELETLRRYQVRTDVTTNGMPLTRKGLLEALLPVCHCLTVSFDGATKETFEYVRKGASFDVVLDRLAVFQRMRLEMPPERRPVFGMSHVFQHANATELVALVELAKRIGVDHLHVAHVFVHQGERNPTSMLNYPRLANEMIRKAAARAREIGLSARFPEPLDASAPETLTYTRPETQWLIDEARRRLVVRKYEASEPPPGNRAALEELGRRGGSNSDLLALRDHGRFLPRSFDYGVPQLGDSLIPAGQVKANRCLYPWREAFVSWDGQVSPCCSPALLEAGDMGNLRTSSFAEIWNGPAYQRLRRSIREGRTYKFCRHCYLVNPEDPEAYSLS